MKSIITFALLIVCINLFAVDNFPGNCLEFDGIDDYVNQGNPASLNLQTFTLATWFYRTGDGVTVGTGAGGIAAEPLITRGRGASDGSNHDINYFMGIRGNPKVLVADFEDMADGTNHPIIGTTVIEDNKWYHAVATYDGTTWSLYLNGNLEAQSTEDATPRYDCIQYNAVGTTLNSTEVPSGYFKGWIDEASIWNTARTQADIQSGMHDTLIGTEPNLVSYWQFNESGGTAASDHVSANNGTLHNMDDDDWITSSAPIFTGSGTEADPYWISNLDELGWLSGNSAYWDEYYIQTADIDASDTQYWNSGAGFSPIGIDSDSPFSGNYNGQDHTIDALFIDRSATKK